MSERTITTDEELTSIVGEPLPRTRDKVRPRLLELDRQWLAATPFVVLATCGPGGADASPKGDPAGRLVHVLSDTQIAIAERPGNKRVDGYRNVLVDPRVGLVAIIPGRGDTLRINGRARLVADAPWFDELVVRGHRPLLALVLDIDEVFYHCAKAFMRSQLWEPASWDPEQVPRRAVIARELERHDRSLAELDEYYGPGYAEGLYG